MLLLHGVDRLILLGIALVLGDIGWQGHMAGSVNRLVQGARDASGVLAARLEANQTAASAIVHKILDRGAEHHR